MPYIQVGDATIPLRPGTSRIGGGPDADIQITTSTGAPALAILEVDEHHVTVRRASGATSLRVNGVPLGAEPSPLFHGDRIEVDGYALVFGEDTRLGQTQYIPALVLKAVGDAAAKKAVSDAEQERGSSGGRLVSLVDGREYRVRESGLVIGREVTCDVVVASAEVSRRHAEIVQEPGGYMVRDASTNGVWVNGERVEGTRALIRGDVIRVGSEELRFHADPPMVPSPAAEPARADDAASGNEALPALATLEIVNEGVLKGRCFELRRPLTHLGRGAHNDIVIADESVSDSHAKIQRRDAGWFVVDVGSTNGTYVAGQRIVNEHPIGGPVDVRFGGIKLMFRPAIARAGSEPASGTRVIAARPALRRAVSDRASSTRELRPTPAPTPTPSRALETVPADHPLSPDSAWVVWLAAAALAGAAALLVLSGR